MDKIKEKDHVGRKKMIIPVEYKMWANLRKISYDTQIPMSQLVRWGMEKVINKYEKPVDSE